MKLRYQLHDFSKPGSNGKFFDKESMIKVMESTSFKERLNSHDLMGTVSHKFRWDEESKSKNRDYIPLPSSDLLILNGLAANCTTNLEFIGDKLICEMEVLSTPLGKQIEDLYRINKIEPDVSMVVRQDVRGDTIKIYDFLGVDFTFDPALKTELLETYSKVRNPMNSLSTNSKGSFKKFMANSNANEFSNLSGESMLLSEEDSELESYSIREFIRVRNRTPIQALLLIITDIKNYVRATKPEVLSSVRKLVIEYLTSYLFTKITEVLVSKDTKQVNLVMLFGLNRFCDSRSIMEFQRVAVLVLRERKSLGYISKRSQQLLSEATKGLVRSIFDFICRGVDSDKVEALLGGSNEKTK